MYIPIIGNGDITSPELSKQAFERYGVDAIMIGRASIGAPWIFKEVKHYLKQREKLPKETFGYYLDILKRQVLQSVDRLDERRGILHSRRHIAVCPLFKGIPDFKPTKIAMLKANTVDELFVIMDNIPQF
jgi:tRNA-dihydrouridine synthase